MEERNIVDMGTKLKKLIANVESSVDPGGRSKGVWGAKPENYTKALKSIAIDIIEYPAS